MKIEKKINRLKRKYSKITRYKFAYLKPGETKKRYKRILCHFLIYDPDYGHSIMEFLVKRKDYKTVSQWRKELPEIIENVYIARVLSAINTKGRNWVYRDLILWTGIPYHPKEK